MYSISITILKKSFKVQWFVSSLIDRMCEVSSTRSFAWLFWLYTLRTISCSFPKCPLNSKCNDEWLLLSYDLSHKLLSVFLAAVTLGSSSIKASASRERACARAGCLRLLSHKIMFSPESDVDRWVPLHFSRSFSKLARYFWFLWSQCLRRKHSPLLFLLDTTPAEVYGKQFCVERISSASCDTC